MDNLKENLQKHRVRFEEINACKDESLRKMRLEGLENDMQVCYGIPKVGMLKISAFACSFPEIYRLFTKVKEARWT